MWQLVQKTLIYYWRVMLPVVAGVSVATAVIVGALLVGDSMRGSLRDIALDRIGSIDQVFIAPRWFDQASIERVRQQHSSDSHSLETVLWIQQVVAEHRSANAGSAAASQPASDLPVVRPQIDRATEMTLLGIDDSFWSLGSIRPMKNPIGEQVVLNESLSKQLHVEVGDRITFNVSRQAVVPADSALGKRENETVALPRWEVVAIVPDKSLGRFSLRSDQRPTMNAYASKSALQRSLEIENKINCVIQAHSNGSAGPAPTAESGWSQFDLSLSDLGFRWQHIERTYPNTELGDSGDATRQVNVLSYDQFNSEQMLLPESIVSDALRSLSEFQPKTVLTYLANNTHVVRPSSEQEKAVGRDVPYSTISALNWDLMSRLLEQCGTKIDKPQIDNWVVIHSWMAKELNAKVGDTLNIDYYLPETVDGKEVEKAFDVHVIGIVPIAEPATQYRRNRVATFDSLPTVFNDPAWTPEVPGITDQDSIAKWETPFPLERPIDVTDDEYWSSHRLTPKLFISSDLGLKEFGSRFGDTTSLRFDGLSEQNRTHVETELTRIGRSNAASLGWREIPVRLQQLRAASGTTPFDALFMSLSFFVIVSALLLVALLFRLSVETRANHWGLLLASGWTRSKVGRLMIIESTCLSAFGAIAGVGLGMTYAAAMLSGLQSWWVGAITVSFLKFHITPTSLLIGAASGMIVSVVSTWFVIRQLLRVPIARLLRGITEDEVKVRRSPRWILFVVGLSGVGALACIFGGQYAQGQARAGAFVGAGMMLMIAGVMFVYHQLKQVSNKNTNASLVSTRSLASSSAQRAPLRSILTVGLMSTASFLVLSMSLFQASPDRAGTGGFTYIGRSSQSIHVNIGDPKVQRQALGDLSEATQSSQVVPLRVRSGDDASCNNLYQATEPQILGISTRMGETDVDEHGKSEFAWFATEKRVAANVRNSPWSSLERTATGLEDSPLPVVLDQNTALWSLHLGGYVGERFSFEFDRKRIHFQIVGVLQNTILQGSLIIGEANFERVFPDITGYRMFLFKSKLNIPESARRAFEQGWQN